MRRFCVVVMAFSICLTKLIFAQSGTGQLKGNLKDNGNKPADMVAVLLYADTAAVALARTVSDEKGEYGFKGLKPGKYRLEFGIAGLQRLQLLNVQVKADSISNLSLQMCSINQEEQDSKAARKRETRRQIGEISRSVFQVLLQVVLTD